MLGWLSDDGSGSQKREEGRGREGIMRWPCLALCLLIKPLFRFCPILIYFKL